jgi:hypothetical protein
MNPYDYHDRIVLLQHQAAMIREHAGVPTFASTLKIDRARMGAQTREAMAIAEVIFRQWHCPDTREAMIECVEEVLKSCNAVGVLYPARVLERRDLLRAGDLVLERRSAPLFER